MPSLFRSTLFALPIAAVALAATALTPATAKAQSAAVDDAQRAAIETVIRDYLMKNPEIILQAVESLQQRQKVAEAERSKRALVDNQQALTRNPADPVAGNPQGDITVVEFFDYQCGYCKAVQADVQRLIKDDGKLRFVFKELPILGPASVVAARASLAARAQGKYLEFHNALMGQRGQIDEDTILRLAKSVGLDTEKLKKDMSSREVQAVIDDNLALAETLGIHGTPGFVFGTELIPGAIKLDEMKRLVAATRSKS